jgi:hypothetical protein
MASPIIGPGGTRGVDQILTNISVAYRNAAEDYLATRVFPIVPVQRSSDPYRIYTKADWFRDEAEERKDGTPAASGSHEYETGTYSCRRFAFKEAVTEQQRGDADNDLDLDRDTTEFVTEKVLLKMERRWASLYFQTGIWTTDRTGVAAGPNATQFVRFSVSGSDPIGVLDGYKQTVKQLTGKTPNKIVSGSNVARYLRNHADVKDRIKYTQTGVVSNALLASLFEVENFYVASAVYEAGKKGAASNMNFIVSPNDLLLVYAAPRPSLKQPSGGYTFASRALPGTNAATGLRMKRYREEAVDAEWFECEAHWDQKVVAADLGVFLSGAVA